MVNIENLLVDIFVTNIFQLRSVIFLSWRFDATTNELVCDKIGVAYPVKNGIPFLTPEDGRLLKTKDSTTNTNNQ